MKQENVPGLSVATWIVVLFQYEFFKMDFMIHGSPTPRNHERAVPGSARNRPGSGRPPSAKPTVNRNPITVRGSLRLKLYLFNNFCSSYYYVTLR